MSGCCKYHKVNNYPKKTFHYITVSKHILKGIRPYLGSMHYSKHDSLYSTFIIGVVAYIIITTTIPFFLLPAAYGYHTWNIKNLVYYS